MSAGDQVPGAQPPGPEPISNAIDAWLADTKAQRHEGDAGFGPVEYRVELLAHRVIGAAIEVHRHLGPGYLEAVYENAMVIELSREGLTFEQQVPIEVTYKGEAVGSGWVDLIVEQSLVVELKAVKDLAHVHVAQVVSYLKATGNRLGLLINFNVPAVRFGVRRVIHG